MKFLFLAFAAAFLFGMTVSDGQFRAAEAIGIAAGMTAAGALVLRFSDARWAAVSMTAIAGLMLIGH